MATQRTPGRLKPPSQSKPKPRAKGLRTPISAEVRALPATQGMLAEVRNELLERITALDVRLTGRIDAVEARLSEQMHLLAADVARLGALLEEQNARNAIVLEALTGMIERQDRADRRMDALEDMVRSLASGARR
jgi:hypothetical protein